MGYDLLHISSFATRGYHDTCFRLKLLSKGRKVYTKTIFENLSQSKFITVVAVNNTVLLDLTPNILVLIYRCFGKMFSSVFPTSHFPGKWRHTSSLEMTVHFYQFTNLHAQTLYYLSLLLHCALWIHLIYCTPTNAQVYCNSLKSLH